MTNKNKLTRLGEGLYDYRGVAITLHSRAVGWKIVLGGETEIFPTRVQAARQVDRHLATLAELTAAPTNAQLAALNLGDYVTDDLLFAVQKALADQGIPRSRSNIASHCNPGYDGSVKRLMLRYILSSLLGL